MLYNADRALRTPLEVFYFQGAAGILKLTGDN